MREGGSEGGRIVYSTPLASSTPGECGCVVARLLFVGPTGQAGAGRGEGHAVWSEQLPWAGDQPASRDISTPV